MNYVVWKIKVQHITLASTSAPRSFGYMALEILPKSKQRHVSPKCDVYSVGVLLIELVNGSRFTLDKGKIHKFIQIHIINYNVNIHPNFCVSNLLLSELEK